MKANMASNTLFRLSPPVTATTFSVGFLGLGAFHFLTPIQICGFFGLPYPSFKPPTPVTVTGKDCPDEYAEPAALPFIYANGGRELMLSIAFGIMGVQHNREGMSALMYGVSVRLPALELMRLFADKLLGQIAAQIDAYIVWRYGGVKYGGWKGRWIMHSFGGIVVGLLAWNQWFY